jgi:hypothetical protein
VGRKQQKGGLALQSPERRVDPGLWANSAYLATLRAYAGRIYHAVRIGIGLLVLFSFFIRAILPTFRN